MISPMVPSLTQSQIHSLVTSGLATIDGGTLAAFVSMGVSITDLWEQILLKFNISSL